MTNITMKANSPHTEIRQARVQPNDSSYLLLNAGILAGPIYLGLGLIQILIRPGFDPTRDDWSLMSNGSLGWIQIMNLLLCGLLVLLFAIGARRSMHAEKRSAWGPRLVGLYGIGLLAAGIFVADPMNGFPAGTPMGPPIHPTLHGTLHIAAGGIGFLGLIAACFIFARHFSAAHEKTWSWFSTLTGLLFFGGFFGIAAGSRQTGVGLQIATLAFTGAVVLSWVWMMALAFKLRRNA